MTINPKIMTLETFINLLTRNHRNHTKQLVETAINDFNLLQSDTRPLLHPTDVCICPSEHTVNFACPWHGVEGRQSRVRQHFGTPVASRVADVKGDD